METIKPLKKISTILILQFAFVAGLIVAELMMWVAFKHNPQGEYCTYIDVNSCKIQWLNLFRVGLLSGIPTFLVLSGIGLLIKKIRTRSNFF